MLKCVLLSFFGQNPVNLAPIGSCIYAHVHSSVFNAAITLRRFMSSSTQLTMTGPLLQHSKVMKLWRYVLFLKPFLFHVILSALKRCKCTCSVAAAVSRLALTTNQTEEQINFGGLKLEKWC